jgi:hypothetical protein
MMRFRKGGNPFASENIKLRSFSKRSLGMIPFAFGVIALEQLGPSLSNCHVWMRKIKNVFDPENSSDHSSYRAPEPQKPPAAS